MHQFIQTDPAWASERFSGAFSDWDGVVEASRRLAQGLENQGAVGDAQGNGVSGRTAYQAGLRESAARGMMGTFPESGTKETDIEAAVNADLNFASKPLKHMENPNRSVPVQVLKEAIGSGTPYPDPKGSSVQMFYTRIYKNGQMYNLEVLYEPKTNKIYHFKYSRKAMGPLPEIK